VENLNYTEDFKSINTDEDENTEIINKINQEKKVIFKPIYDGRYPQQYIKCLIKESDLLFERSDIVLQGASPLIPVRLKMTLKAISVLLSPNEILFQIFLKNIKIFNPPDNNCILLIDGENKSKYKFCNLLSNTSPRSSVEDWAEDIRSFKNKCIKKGEKDYTKLQVKIEKREELMRRILNNRNTFSNTTDIKNKL
jgi:hypothetical protein